MGELIMVGYNRWMKNIKKWMKLISGHKNGGCVKLLDPPVPLVDYIVSATKTKGRSSTVTYLQTLGVLIAFGGFRMV